MRCSSYCTAADFKMDGLVSYLNEQGLDPKFFNEVIHIQKEWKKDEHPIDAFFFPFGCVVIWNHRKKILSA